MPPTAPLHSMTAFAAGRGAQAGHEWASKLRSGPVGRKLDFLSREINREPNTLCAKAQDQMLTQIGLDWKAVVDQLGEQVQNIE